MESSTQTSVYSYLSPTPTDFQTSKDPSVDTSTQTILAEPIRFIYLNSQSVKAVKDETKNEPLLDDDEDIHKIRPSRPMEWRQSKRKYNKNRGLEYVKTNGELCKKKVMGPPCNCKMKCFQRIGEESCKKVFQNFWKLGDYSLQNAYIAGGVRIMLPKNMSKNSQSEQKPSRRFYTRSFYVNVNGIDTEICKQAFLNLHSISNGRLDRLLKKKQEIGNTGVDERGKHNNKVNKIPIEKIQHVRRSIDDVRKRAGFNGKRKSQYVEILPASLNIRIMYKKYAEEMRQKGLEPVCEFRYRKIFHTDYHLDFARAPPLILPSKQKAAPTIQTSVPPQSSMQQPSNYKIEKIDVAAVNFGDEDKPVYTMLESKDGGSTYVALSQDMYQSYGMPSQGWIFPAQN